MQTWYLILGYGQPFVCDIFATNAEYYFRIKKNIVPLQNNFNTQNDMIRGIYKVWCLRCHHSFIDIDAETNASAQSTPAKRCPKCGSRLIVRIPKTK